MEAPDEREPDVVPLDDVELVLLAPEAKRRPKPKLKTKATAGQLPEWERHCLDHEHKHPDCTVCNQVRVQQRHHGRADEPRRLEATNLGDHVFGDHWIEKVI